MGATEQPARQTGHDQPSTVPSREEKLSQVERILASRTFLNARTLQNFLRYVATKAIDGQEDEVKEYTVGVQVLRKGSDFDPRTDTQVRTEATRLRSRLEIYYATEGAADGLRVELPRGHYVPQFSWNTVSKAAQAGNGSADDAAGGAEPPMAVSRAPRYARLRTGLLVGVAAVAAFWAGRSFNSPDAHVSHELHTDSEDTLLTNLWSRIVEPGNPVMIAFSNPAFLVNDRGEFVLYTESVALPLGTLVSGVRVPQGSGINPGSGPLSFFDAYTGVGEVSAVLEIDRLFRRLGSAVEVKRGRLVTTDDLHRRNAVFAGSPEVNGVLENLRLPGEFAFTGIAPPDGQPGVDLWKVRITNLHPQPGEKREFPMERDPATGALLSDYGVVSFLPGIAPRRTIVMLAGVLDGGTAAAAEFATSAAGVQELTDHLGIPDPKFGKRLPPFFQALVRVEYARGMSLGIHYVTGHVIQPQRSAFFAGAAGSNGADELK